MTGTAPQRLRALVGELSEGERAQPWSTTGDLTRYAWVKAGNIDVANAGLGASARAAARLIAAVASPDRVLLLAALMESVRAALPWIDSDRGAVASILRQRLDALEASLTTEER